MCGFFQKYIKDFAELCKPLNQLKKKNVKFKQSNERQTSYEKLKYAIPNIPLLQIADFTKPFALMCDASFHCSGACLMQENENNDLLPVAYYPKKFNDAQLKYTIYEKCTLSVVQAMEKWQEFLEVQS